MLRQGFVPKFIVFTGSEGKSIPSDNRPDALVDYFEHKHWGRTEPTPHTQSEESQPALSYLFLTQAPIRTDDYTIGELSKVLKRI